MRITNRWKVTQKIHSMRQRMILIMVFGIIVWCMVVGAITWYSFRTTEKNRMKNAMRTDITQLTEQLDEEYYSLVKISQQMTVEGNIGASFSAYLQAEEPYDKIEHSNNVTTGINTMIFNYKSGVLASYYSIEDNESRAMFSSFPVRERTFENPFPVLTKSSEIEFQTFHACINEFSDREVISLVRKVDFGTGNFIIYAECNVDIGDWLQRLSVSRDADYTLLLLNEKDQICYSSNPAFQVNGQFRGKEEFGEEEGHRFAAMRSDFGFRNILLIDHRSYLRQEYYWQTNIVLVFCIGIISIVLVVILFFYFIYRPIRQLGQDMEDAGQGNLQPVEREFHMDEFDRLFTQFNDMKNKVAKLMEEVRRSEYEKQQLEIEKLYYQINPHFLMNALNSLHWMAVASHQKEIEEYIYQLNFILGYSLGKIYKNATFGTELKSLDMYLELQKKRYDFNVWQDIRMKEWLDYPCARLILQPLAENAICHNMDAFGNLWITMTCENHVARIVIRDDGQGIHFLSGEAVSARRQNKGIGLRYVQMSLQSFYGDKATLRIESEVNKGTTVIVDIPLCIDEGRDEDV